MPFSKCKRQTVAIVLLLFTQINGLSASTVTISATPGVTTPPPTSQPSSATCEARTINYITHRLPQQCLKSSWHDVNGTSSPRTEGAAETTGYADTAEISTHTTESPTEHISIYGSDGTQEPSVKAEASGEISTTASDAPATTSLQESRPTQTAAEEDPAFGDATFISFEDWKQQNLEKVGQNLEIGERRQKPGSQDRDSIHHALDTLGDEGEISLDFIGFTGQGRDEIVTPGETETGTGSIEAQKTAAVKLRSKDAGTTCKERFNYASFDAGSTIKKSNPEAKSVTKILSENKDGYMLNICSATNKFFIVELSDDILIDTVVLANFEFFSSQFRQFRVSVSDRYPVKLDRWVELGTYEAQNARGIQAFLVEEPKIWARYLKIEFLTHFGKEYYCPVSLLRVHGRTMISEFRAEEEAARGETDSDEESEGSLEEAGEKLIPEAVAAVVLEEKIAERLKGAQAALHEAVACVEASNHTSETNASQSIHCVSEPPTTPWSKSNSQQWPLGEIELQVCLPSEANANSSSPIEMEKTVPPKEEEKENKSPTAASSTSTTEVTADVSTPESETPPTPIVPPSLMDKLSKTVADMKESVKTLASSSASARSDNDTVVTAVKNVTTKPSQTNSKSNSTTSTASPPAPSTQESFFKTVHKRLQFLEANSTLSLQYIESQSALLRDAFQKVEKRQLAKTTNFLESLNETVMNELRAFRQQYDQIWQSTVIELESQRERSEREILEVSRRMTLLADEVIFQKRMSIVQSVVLLLCLGLVLLSNRGQRAYLELPMGMKHVLYGGSPGMNDNGHGSLTPQSPSSGLDDGTPLHREVLRPNLRHAHSSWEDNTHKRTKSYDSLNGSDALDRSSIFEESPSTPHSIYSKPLPEINGSSSPRKDYLGMGLRTNNGAPRSSASSWTKGIGEEEQSQEKNANHSHSVVDFADQLLHESDDSDSGHGDQVEYNQSPGFRRSSTLKNTNGHRPGDEEQSFYVTPPPEDGLRKLSANDAQIESKRAPDIVRKPLPALPIEVDDDESDEDMT